MPIPVEPTRFPVVLLWHLHQPEYRVGDRYLLPWTFLHALSAYTDMATLLQEQPQARCVVNFSPVLLAQLQDYARRLRHWQQAQKPPGDALLDALVALPSPGPERAALVQRCLPHSPNARSDSVPAYVALAARLAGEDPATLADTALGDLLTGFCLSWTGSWLRQHDPRVQALLQQGGGYGLAQRHSLLHAIADALSGVLPRWRALADAGQVELCMSPYYHPLLPLLLDFASARDAAPGLPLPPGRYPDGAARARWHLEEGLRHFESVFGQRPSGCWPSEAALSADTLALLASCGFGWTASAQSVLANTARRHAAAPLDPFRPYQVAGSRLHCLFRDDGLSDRIGFSYQHWSAADAAADLTGHLERIAAEPGRRLALIALDGENPWEFFPQHGASFLRALYDRLATHPRLRLATPSSLLAAGVPAEPLPPLCAGSWVHGELLTWIGHPEKNRAWELLMAARQRFDAAGHRDPEALHRLGACEGSDWFWWPGAQNPAPAVADFDALFRAHLAALYERLGEPVPEILLQPFAHGVDHAVPAGGTMQVSS